MVMMNKSLLINKVFTDTVPQYVRPSWAENVLSCIHFDDIDLDGNEQRLLMETELGNLFVPCRVVKSGTQALALALRAVGIKHGNYVAVPAWTCPATCSAVISIGAQPVFVDVDKDTWTMDINDLKNVVDDIDAVVPVDLFGRPSDVNGIRQIVDNKPIVLDACQSLGGQDVALHVADATCTSLYPTKPFGGLTEGGVVFTTNTELLENVDVLACQGRYGECRCDGTNGRFGEFEAALYLACLPYIKRDIVKCMEIANMFRQDLLSFGLQLQRATEKQVVHVMRFVLNDNGQRDVFSQLVEQNKTYSTALSAMPVYNGRKCPVAETLAANTVGVIVCPGMNLTKIVAALHVAKRC